MNEEALWAAPQGSQNFLINQFLMPTVGFIRFINALRRSGMASAFRRILDRLWVHDIISLMGISADDVTQADLMTIAKIPGSLWPYFQEYDPQSLDCNQDADLIIQRTLEYGGWEEIRWLVASYGTERIRKFLRLHGERLLSAPTFIFWRKLLGVRRWRRSPFRKEARQVWPF
ncbi:DUF6922 domain-containing protein [Caldilinea sp.]|uniref:DUF6922 domain-containing protein n=1 Tax=Caldilinea sp. TaxID=2293560 RepID=UPI00261E9C43|nr:hypothetical protein [uncultured Caldilinea sp.]